MVEVKSWSLFIDFLQHCIDLKVSIHVDRDKPFLVTSNFLGESQCFLPTEIIAEIVGLYCGFAYDEQTEWLRVTLGSSGAKKEARRKDIAAAGIEKNV